MRFAVNWTHTGEKRKTASRGSQQWEDHNRSSHRKHYSNLSTGLGRPDPDTAIILTRRHRMRHPYPAGCAARWEARTLRVVQRRLLVATLLDGSVAMGNLATFPRRVATPFDQRPGSVDRPFLERRAPTEAASFEMAVCTATLLAQSVPIVVHGVPAAHTRTLSAGVQTLKTGTGCGIPLSVTGSGKGGGSDIGCILGAGCVVPRGTACRRCPVYWCGGSTRSG